MEMVSIPLEQYQEFLQMRLELNLLYTKCRKDGVYAAGIFIEDAGTLCAEPGGAAEST